MKIGNKSWPLNLVNKLFSSWFVLISCNRFDGGNWPPNHTLLPSIIITFVILIYWGIVGLKFFDSFFILFYLYLNFIIPLILFISFKKMQLIKMLFPLPSSKKEVASWDGDEETSKKRNHRTTQKSEALPLM